MSPLTRVLGYLVFFLAITQGLSGWWLDKDERALGAMPAQILAAHLQDANDASEVARKMILDRANQNQQDNNIALQVQAKADADHERVDLGIQHRQDVANFYFGGSHDQNAMAWAALPVPAEYVDGMCAAFGGHAPGCGEPAAGSELSGPGPGSGPVADGGHGAAGHAPDRQRAGQPGQGRGRSRQLQRR